MSNQSSVTKYLVMGLIIGTLVGYLVAGPLTFNGQIIQLENRIAELEGSAVPLTGSLTVSGSSTVLPITQECATNFMLIHENVQISVSGGGSGHGIKAAGSNEVDIGEASRNIKETEFLSYPNLVVFAVGKDSVAIVINPDNPLAGNLDITLEQASRIFSGNITYWSELGGADHEIEVYTREEGSGTREVFQNYVLEPYERTMSGSATVKPSNGEMRASVSNNEYGIAYISLGYVDSSVNTVLIDGVEATIENVNSGEYPLTRILWMFTNGMPDLLERAFIGYMQSSDGQEVVEDLGYIPIS